MNGAGEFIELQGTGEEATFTEAQLAALLALGKGGIRELLALQRAAIAAVTAIRRLLHFRSTRLSGFFGFRFILA